MGVDMFCFLKSPSAAYCQFSQRPVMKPVLVVQVLHSGKQRDGTREQQLLVDATLHMLEKWSSEMER